MRKTNVLCLSLLVLMMLSGCTTENKEEKIDVSQTALATKNNNTKAELELINNSSKININLCLMKNNIKRIPILMMDERQNDFECIREVFFKEKDQKEEIWENDFGKAIRYIGKEGDKLDIYTGYIRYSTPLGNHMRSIFNPKTATASNNKSKKLFDLLTSVKEISELNFKTKTDVIKDCVDFCRNIGIEVDPNTPLVYALEYKKINKLQEQLLEEDYFLKEFEPRILDTNDSCYYIVFEIKQDNLPIDPSGYTDRNTGDLINGSSVIMIVSSRGTEYFEILGSLYEKKDVLKENSDLVPAQSCLDTFINKYDNDLLVKNVDVDNIKLYYVPISEKNSDNIIFRPSWIFYSEVELIVDEKSAQTYKLRDVMRIDAISGEEII